MTVFDRGTHRIDAKNLVAWGAALLIVGLFLWEFGHTTEQADDAYITYRYARNLTEGHGLVFNVGQAVEGYTNLLWTLLVSVGVFLGADAPDTGLILALFSGVLFLLSTQWLAVSVLPKAFIWLAPIAPLVIYCSNSFTHWSTSGLETCLFGALLVLSLLTHLQRRPLWTSFLCILLSMTRPEGMLLGGMLLGWDWLCRLDKKIFAQPKRLLSISLPPLLFVAYLIGHLAFRLFYYHDYVPNTFHAKVGGIPVYRGLEYVKKFLLDGPVLLLPAAIWAWIVDKRTIMSAALVIVTFAYTIYVGGDIFMLGRFLLPVFPILIVFNLLGVAYLVRWKKTVGIIFMAAPFLCIGWGLYLDWPKPNDFRKKEVKHCLASGKRISAKRHVMIPKEYWINMVDKMKTLEPPVKVVGSISIGRLGYYAPDVEILDILGLTDKTIAKSEKIVTGRSLLILPGHQRTDSDYVLDRKPDVLLIPKVGEKTFLLPAVKDLWDNPRLLREYEWDNSLLAAYRRKDLAN